MPYLYNRGYSPFGGMQIKTNPLVPAFQDVPVRKHVQTAGGKASYHRRIQKKWLKRYGTKNEAVVYLVGNTLICNPEVADHIRKTLSAPVVDLGFRQATGYEASIMTIAKQN